MEADLRLGRERKEELEAEKKRVSKSIKIGNDYFDTFHQSSQFFDDRIADTQLALDLLQDRLVLAWSALCFLAARPPADWIPALN